MFGLYNFLFRVVILSCSGNFTTVWTVFLNLIPSRKYRNVLKFFYTLSTFSSSGNIATKTMPDLKHSDLMQELKLRQEEIKTTTINISGSRNLSSSTLTKPPKRKIVADHGAGGSGSGGGGVSEIKSFSSRFVSQTKPHPAGILDSIII